jgi:hypothetical protein
MSPPVFENLILNFCLVFLTFRSRLFVSFKMYQDQFTCKTAYLRILVRVIFGISSCLPTAFKSGYANSPPCLLLHSCTQIRAMHILPCTCERPVCRFTAVFTWTPVKLPPCLLPYKTVLTSACLIWWSTLATGSLIASRKSHVHNARDARLRFCLHVQRCVALCFCLPVNAYDFWVEHLQIRITSIGRSFRR